MILANWTYAPLILGGGFIVLMVYSVYLAWKRSVVRKMTGEKGSIRRIVSGSEKIRIAKNVMIYVSIVVFCFVLLRPQWGDRVKQVPSEGRDILVVLDVSRSMLARDTGETRLDRAKETVRILAGSQEGARMGLVLFAGDAFLQCPLTSDRGAFLMFLDAAGPASMAVQGTDMGRALETAQRVFAQKRLTSRMLVFITDGEDHEGRALEMADKFREMGIALYCIGVGSEQGEAVPADIDDDTGQTLSDNDGRSVVSRKNAGLLKEMAEKTGGAYADITDGYSDLGSVERAIDSEKSRQNGMRRIHEKEDRYTFFVLMLVLFLSAEMLIPEYVPPGKSFSLKGVTGIWRKHRDAKKLG